MNEIRYHMSIAKSISWKTKGRLLYIDEHKLYKAYNGSVLKSTDSGITWKTIITLPVNSTRDIIANSQAWIRRILRKGIHHFNLGQENLSCLLYDKKIALYEDGHCLDTYDISGSRPLSLEFINEEFVFGEYRSNPERSGIGIYAFSKKKQLYKKAEMTGIRHIHGIYEDPYTSQTWISTGDTDHEAALIRTDNHFRKLEKVLSGTQQSRAIKLLFTEKYIYFGSDAPDEINHLYRMDKFTGVTELLAEVGSSVFHGYKSGNWLFFSTAVEPSKMNRTKYAELWASPDGESWKCIIKYKKDLLPMKLFQYGQIFFPAGPGNGKDLWISPFATRNSNQSYRFELKEIKKLFYVNTPILLEER